MLIGCSKCNKDAVYLRRYTAERLCKSCLMETTVDRVRKAINRQKMLRDDDRIVVAISGGKDSAVLLDVLHRIEQNYPRTELIPLIIDEGIQGYRDKALDAARDLTNTLGMHLEVRKFEDMFSHSLDDIVRLRGEGKVIGACSYCGVFRRRAINTAAKELGADVVATGHNMDDEAQTIMMNMMRGDSKRIARTNRSREKPVPGLVSRIKPVIELSERDIVAYAHQLSLPYHDVPCPYSAEAYRNDMRFFLNEMEHKRPGTLTSILRSGEAVSKAFLQIPTNFEFGVCSSCGEPTPLKQCKVCKLLDDIKKRESG